VPTLPLDGRVQHPADKLNVSSDSSDQDHPRTATPAETALSAVERFRVRLRRHPNQLSAAGRLVLDHLRAAKGRAHAVPWRVLRRRTARSPTAIGRGRRRWGTGRVTRC